jgi:hypothetical protein
MSQKIYPQQGSLRYIYENWPWYVLYLLTHYFKHVAGASIVFIVALALILPGHISKWVCSTSDLMPVTHFIGLG